MITQSQSPAVVKFNMSQFYEKVNLKGYPFTVEKLSPRAGFELGPLDQ